MEIDGTNRRVRDKIRGRGRGRGRGKGRAKTTSAIDLKQGQEAPDKDMVHRRGLSADLIAQVRKEDKKTRNSSKEDVMVQPNTLRISTKLEGFVASRKRKNFASDGKQKSRARKQYTRNFSIRTLTNRQPPSAPTPAQFPGADLDNPLETPATGNGIENPKFKGSSAPDKLHAEGLAPDLDFYGTNEGLTLFDDKNETEAPQQTDQSAGEAEGSHSLPVQGEGIISRDRQEVFKSLSDSRNTILQRMRRKIKEQEEYIGELEDTVLELQEKLESHKKCI